MRRHDLNLTRISWISTIQKQTWPRINAAFGRGTVLAQSARQSPVFSNQPLMRLRRTSAIQHPQSAIEIACSRSLKGGPFPLTP